MAFLILDVDDTGALQYDEIAPLEGVEYLFSFYWSTRESCWYFDLSDQDEVPIAHGVKLVVSFPILRRFLDPRLPPGLLLCADMSGALKDIEVPGDLGARVLLIYFTSDDVSVPELSNVNIRRPG